MQNNRHKRLITAAAVLATLLSGGIASSAEIQLRRECRATSPVVRLADIADIYATDADEKNRLANVELFVAPGGSTSKRVTSREIQDTLALRGIAIGKHRFSGSAVVKVHSQMSSRFGGGRLSSSVVKKSNRKVSAAIVAYLQQNVAASDPWQVEVELPASQTQQILSSADSLKIRGGAEPWTGRQEFVATIGALEIPIRARVTLPPMVVVAVRAIGRGDLIRASDVELKPLQPKNSALAVLHSLKDAVGKEAIRSIAEGQVVPSRNVRAPILVSRGDIVNVVAYSDGIRVKTMARSRQKGSLGELVEIESIVDRKQRHYMARVSGVGQVEVYAHLSSVKPANFPQATEKRR